ncbi:hypothetical protein QEN19_002642 [Hanseniaspora menglaensis]
MNDNKAQNPRQELFKDIFGAERKRSSSFESNSINLIPRQESLNLYDIISDNARFLEETVQKLKENEGSFNITLSNESPIKNDDFPTSSIAPLSTDSSEQLLLSPKSVLPTFTGLEIDSANKDSFIEPIKLKTRLNVDTKFTESNESTNSSLFGTPIKNKQHHKVLSTASRVSSVSSSFMQQAPETPLSSYGGSIKKLYVNNPQLLSKVATKLCKLVQPTSNYHPKQPDLLVHNSFFGGHCVDILCKILKTNDRTLAVLYGRSLQQQGVIKDCFNKQNLRDNNHELYFINHEILENVNGVFVLLSKCYSPTCTRENQCYSLSCPRRKTLKKQRSTRKLNKIRSLSNLNAKSLNSSITNFSSERRKSSSAAATPLSSKPSMNFSSALPTPTLAANHNQIGGNIIIQSINQNFSAAAANDEKTLWSSSVPMEILEGMQSKEIKRQEAIFEVYVTEKNFVKSLETVRDSIIKTLAETNIIPHDIRKNFIKHVFAHVNDIYSVNKRFLDSLNERMHPQDYMISGIDLMQNI